MRKALGMVAMVVAVLATFLTIPGAAFAQTPTGYTEVGVTWQVKFLDEGLGSCEFSKMGIEVGDEYKAMWSYQQPLVPGDEPWTEWWYGDAFPAYMEVGDVTLTVKSQDSYVRVGTNNVGHDRLYARVNFESAHDITNPQFDFDLLDLSGTTIEPGVPVGSLDLADWADYSGVQIYFPSEVDPSQICRVQGPILTLTSSEILPPTPGTIVVRKVTNPASDQVFDFAFAIPTSTGPLETGFVLSDGQGWVSRLLDPGTYSVAELVPDGWTLTSAVCDDESDPAEISLQAGERVTCTFTNTKDSPPPRPEPSPPTGAIGDLVWLDANADGYQGDFETGVAGVTVNLLNSGGSVIATVVTDAGGKYLFAGLAAGGYEVQFVLPAGFEASGLRVAAAALDSDAGVAGRTGAITLASGVTDLTWDAGIFETAQVLPQVITATTTTVQQTTETLPFTGTLDGQLGGFGAALLVFGGLVLVAVRRREEEGATAVLGGSISWSRYRGKHRK